LPNSGPLLKFLLKNSFGVKDIKENLMPAKLDRCVKKVQAQGRSKSSSFAICNASIKGGGKKKSTKK
jgi:hypothetical protein